MEFSATVIAAASALAALCGFASHRGSLCAVKAVDQILAGHRPHLAESFLRAGLWALLTATMLDALAPTATMHASRFTPTLLGLGGAFLFGVGAAVNGGCALSTLSRLATGEGAKIGTIAGFVAGAALAGLAFRVGMLPMPRAIASAEAGLFRSAPWQAAVLAVPALTLLLFDLGRQLRKPFRRAGWRGVVLARQHRPLFAAALLGVSGGALVWAIGAWSYTALARRLGLAAAGWMPGGVDMALLVLLFASTFAGAVLSARMRGGLRFRRGARRGWAAAFFGGSAMGFGIATVPGGNDELLLVAIPALSPHALPSYAMLALGIAVVLALKRRG